jgi:uncharacterized SAM-binding protein YcdF (DUF218 family)
MPVLLAGIVLAWALTARLRRACGRRRHWLDYAGAALAFAVCWPPVAWTLLWGLERHYPIATYPAGDAQAMVVLAGNLYSANRSQPETAPGFSTYIRVSHAAWLYRHWRPLPIIVAGGSTGEPGDLPLAELMRRQLAEEGVPPAMITAEADSLNTYQNAVNAAAILRARGLSRVALVTEAFHMRRAELCFRKQGLDVAPSPVAYRTLELTHWNEVLLPSLWAIRNNSESLHEWAGLAWYKLRGRI